MNKVSLRDSVYKDCAGEVNSTLNFEEKFEILARGWRRIQLREATNKPST
jgi:hypothetical protein